MARRAFLKRAQVAAPDQRPLSTIILEALNKEDRSPLARARAALLEDLTSRMIENKTEPGCPALVVLQHMGDRWLPLVLLVLTTGTYRHTELQRVINALSEISHSTPVSQHILTRKLRSLEREGLVHRKVWPVVPPRTDYSLTPLGRSLASWVPRLVRWGEAHAQQILQARKKYDSAHTAPSRPPSTSPKKRNLTGDPVTTVGSKTANTER